MATCGGESGTMIKQCLQCGKEIVKRPNHDKIYWSNRKFCSNECNGLWRTGSNHWNWKGGCVEKVCEFCHSVFEVSRAKKDAARFCSRSCNASFHMIGNKYRLGYSPANKSLPMSVEQKQKLSLAKIGKVGQLCNAWKHGLTETNILIRSSVESKEWKRCVLKRDNYTCQHCGKRGGILNVHHILSFAEYSDLRFEVDNGITLCKKCHYIFHSKYGFTNNNPEQIKDMVAINQEA